MGEYSGYVKEKMIHKEDSNPCSLKATIDHQLSPKFFMKRLELVWRPDGWLTCSAMIAYVRDKYKINLMDNIDRVKRVLRPSRKIDSGTISPNTSIGSVSSDTSTGTISSDTSIGAVFSDTSDTSRTAAVTKKKPLQSQANSLPAKKKATSVNTGVKIRKIE